MSIVDHGIQAVRVIRTYSSNIAATATFAGQTTTAQYLRVSPQVSCFYKIGTATDTAATTGVSDFLAAGVVEYRKCAFGSTVHCISATGGTGIMTIGEVVD